jgi:hypothetical protein
MVVRSRLHVEFGGRDDHALHGSGDGHERADLDVLRRTHDKVRHRVPVHNVRLGAFFETEGTGRTHLGVDLRNFPAPRVAHRGVGVLSRTGGRACECNSERANGECPWQNEAGKYSPHVLIPSRAVRSDLVTSDNRPQLLTREWKKRYEKTSKIGRILTTPDIYGTAGTT